MNRIRTPSGGLTAQEKERRDLKALSKKIRNGTATEWDKQYRETLLFHKGRRYAREAKALRRAMEHRTND